MNFSLRYATFVVVLALNSAMPGLAWQQAKGPLATKWAKEVSPENALKEYPRPQMVRYDWLNLNGLWDFAIQERNTDAKAQWPGKADGQILVPFPIESALSGVMKHVGESNYLWYRRTFTIPANWAGKQVLLHFGAVDWETTVYVNGKEVGSHRGGYDGFSFNITAALKGPGRTGYQPVPAGNLPAGREQELVVRVWDPTNAGTQPRGKQVNKPGGIWYTPTTGIWQTAWLEPVAETSLEDTHLVPDIDAGVLNITARVRGNSDDATLQAIALDGDREVGRATGRAGKTFQLAVPNAKLWSPDSPHLYNLKLAVARGGKTVDEVTSYFGMRKSSLGKDDKGTLRLFLNNKPLFQFGPLDQGFWPDGIYTAPTDEALRYDIEMTRRLGFNLARKHVKVEPDRWYYWCDKLGLLVWQDMPSGDRYIRSSEPDIQRAPESAREFDAELKALIDGRWNHPCIVMWVPFNEGWGQFDTDRVTTWIKKYDPSRLVNSASGWTDRHTGDVHDIHSYPGPASPKIETARAGVLGEYGGLGLPVSGHTWQEEKNWGYRSYKTPEELTAAYLVLIKKLRPMTGAPGLAAAVYTQTTDVEVEVNGLMTYDRALVKMKEDVLAAANRKVYLPPPPPPTVHTISPTSEKEAVQWRYTTEKPAESWAAPDFDDSQWRTASGGFGEPSTPGSVVRTTWKTADIWLRRSFEVPAGFQPHDLQLAIHHDEDAQVYVNGKLVATTTGYISAYDLLPLDARIKEALKPGKNTLAVHCHQTTGGQYIDVGLADVIEADEQ